MRAHTHTHTHTNTHLYQHSEDGINMPPLVGAVFVGRYQSIGGNVGLELWLCHVEKIQNLLHYRSNVVRVDECEGELESSTADGDVALLEAVQDGGAVTLDSIVVDRHCPE